MSEVLVREWTRLIGSPDFDEGLSVSTAADGSIYIVGSTAGNLDGKTNSGKSDAFLSKYNSDGSKAWTQLLGTSTEDWAWGSSVGTDDSIYIIGRTGGDLDGQTNSSRRSFISKYNSDGSKAWTKLLGSSEGANSVSTAADGSFYITGSTESETNSDESDAFLSKYNSDGSKAWTQFFGSTGYAIGYGISTAADGSVYISGANVPDVNSSERDIFLSKYNSDGSKSWTRLIGARSEWAGPVSTAADGSVYISGHTFGNLDGQTNSGERDVLISKYKSDGSKEWTRLFGSSSDEYALSISTDAGGSVYILGYSDGDLDGQPNSDSGNRDAFLSKYNSNGSKLWTKLIGSSSTSGGG